MTSLNLISVIGLVAMLAMAWAMSSHRSRVNWRLVFWGVVLQLAFAAVFFNSQRWTFDRTFDNAEALVEAVSQGEIDPELVTLPARAEVDNAQTLGAFIQSSEVDGKLPPDLASLVQGRMDAWPVTVPRYPGGIVFAGVQGFFDLIDDSVAAGRGFVFTANPPATDPQGLIGTFAFGILPTVIFFASLMAVLYYLGIMQLVVRGMAWLMQRTLKTTPAESLAAAANVFVGHTEAPLVVKPYIAGMTRSELNALMVGGFSTISGSLMAVFATFEGISAGHLLTASLISAPAALVVAKILQPETETPRLDGRDLASVEDDETRATNVIEAAAIGAGEGMKLAINIAAMLIAFLALIALCDFLLQGVGSWIGLELSLGRIFGWVFYPLAWVMGVASGDCAVAGDLLGKKMVINEFVAYMDLEKVALDEVASGEGITERTRVILTYALCGFSNFGAIGIQLGGIGPLAPERRSDLAQLGLRAMFGGMLVACMTACVAGMFFGVLK